MKSCVSVICTKEQETERQAGIRSRILTRFCSLGFLSDESPRLLVTEPQALTYHPCICGNVPVLRSLRRAGSSWLRNNCFPIRPCLCFGVDKDMALPTPSLGGYDVIVGGSEL